MRRLYALYRSFLFVFAYLWYILDTLFDELDWGEMIRIPVRMLFIVIYPLLWVLICIVTEIVCRKRPDMASTMVLHTLKTVDLDEVFTGSVDKAAKDAAKITCEEE